MKHYHQILKLDTRRKRWNRNRSHGKNLLSCLGHTVLLECSLGSHAQYWWVAKICPTEFFSHLENTCQFPSPKRAVLWGFFAAQNPLINQANASAAEPDKAEGKHVCSIWGSRFLGILGIKGNPHFWAPLSAELAPVRVKSGQSCGATSGRCSSAMLLNQR